MKIKRKDFVNSFLIIKGRKIRVKRLWKLVMLKAMSRFALHLYEKTLAFELTPPKERYPHGKLEYLDFDECVDVVKNCNKKKKDRK